MKSLSKEKYQPIRKTVAGRLHVALVGDTIAAVGNSGGIPESGLYFELRYQGQPLDPLKWVNLK
jgi:hypothetical protein